MKKNKLLKKLSRVYQLLFIVFFFFSLYIWVDICLTAKRVSRMESEASYEVGRAEEYAHTAETKAEESKRYASKAEGYADDASSSASSASSYASTAEEYSNKAERYADDAEEHADDASSSASSAEEYASKAERHADDAEGAAPYRSRTTPTVYRSRISRGVLINISCGIKKHGVESIVCLKRLISLLDGFRAPASCSPYERGGYN